MTDDVKGDLLMDANDPFADLEPDAEEESTMLSF